MYVGGLGAAAGGATSLVGQVPAVTDVPPRRAPFEGDESGSRAASGAARDLRARAAGGSGALSSARRLRPVARLLPLLDLIAVSGAVAVGYALRFGDGASMQRAADLAVASALPLAWVVAAVIHRAYDPRFLGSGTTEFHRLARTFMSVVAATGFISYAADLRLARGFVVLALPSALLLTIGTRMIVRTRLARRRRAGQAMDRVVVVGSAASVPTVVSALRSDPAAGLQVIGVCLPGREAADPDVRDELAAVGVPVLGKLEDVRSLAYRYALDGVAVVAGDVGTGTVRSIGWALEDIGAELIVWSGLAETAHGRVHVQSVGGAPLLRVDAPRFGGVTHLVKGVFDRLAAALALVLLSPLLILLAVIVRCTSRGPALYLQERVGRHGRRFKMIKFRSMHTDAEQRLGELVQHNVADGPLFKLRNDPRVTRVGKWLRRFSLDELPQLLNVLAGSMSLVGPRPPLPSEVALYEGDVRRRLLVKPGLTGLWQVSGRSDLSWEDAVRLDLHYVENWSFGFDLQLLFKTARVVVKAKGAY